MILSWVLCFEITQPCSSIYWTNR